MNYGAIFPAGVFSNYIPTNLPRIRGSNNVEWQIFLKCALFYTLACGPWAYLVVLTACWRRLRSLTERKLGRNDVKVFKTLKWNPSPTPLRQAHGSICVWIGYFLEWCHLRSLTEQRLWSSEVIKCSRIWSETPPPPPQRSTHGSIYFGLVSLQSEETANFSLENTFSISKLATNVIPSPAKIATTNASLLRRWSLTLSSGYCSATSLYCIKRTNALEMKRNADRFANSLNTYFSGNKTPVSLIAGRNG